jgi:polyisoprenoid-binding protein YceI
MPTSFPATVEKTLKGKLSFHGVDKQVELPVKVLFNSASSATATTQLSISMDEFKIERPSLMFVKVDDALKIDVNLTLKN